MKQIYQNQKNKEQRINQNFTILSNYAAFGDRSTNINGGNRTFLYYGGKFFNYLDNTAYDIADGFLSLTANSTNYIYINPFTNVIEFNTTGFLNSCISLYIATTDTSNIISITDARIKIIHSDVMNIFNAIPYRDTNLKLNYINNSTVQVTGGHFKNIANKKHEYIAQSGNLALTANSNNYIQIKNDNSSDPYWDDVIFLSHFEDASPAFDNVKKTTQLNLFGNAARSTTYKKFGTYSLKFDGTGDYALSDAVDLFNMAHCDFTIEFFASFANVATGSPVMLEIGTSGTNSIKLHLATSLLTLTIQNVVKLQKATAIPLNAMHYYCLVKKGGATKNSFQLFYDTTLVGTVNDVSLLTTANQELCLGYEGLTPTASTYMNGYIDELRITKGVARYWDTVTVPTAAFTESTYSFVVNTTHNSKYATLYNIVTDASNNIIDIDNYYKKYRFKYNSFGQQNTATIAANTIYSYTHNQRIEDTEKPLQIQAILKCKTAELGYSIGDESTEWTTGATIQTANHNLIISADYTTLKVAFGNNIYLSNATTGTMAAATFANWELVFRINVL